MSNIVLIPRFAASTTWNDPTNALLSDSLFTVNPSGAGYATHCLRCSDFDKSSLPNNITITGIQVNITAKISASSSTARLLVQLGSSKKVGRITSLTTLGSSIVTGTLGTSSAIVTAGGNTSPFSAWNYDFTYYYLNKNEFSVNIYPYGDSAVDYSIDYVTVTVYYTTSGYLSGCRSSFNLNGDNPDLFSRTIPGQVDPVYRVDNGLGIGFQVQSEQLNFLGDALYNMQTTAINKASTNQVFVLGNNLKQGCQYFFSMGVTGTVTSAPSGIVYQKGYKAGTITPNTVIGMSNIVRTASPLVTQRMECYYTSAIGWIISGGVNTPVYVSPSRMVFDIDPNTGEQNYLLAFSAYGSGIVTSYQNETAANILPYYGAEISSMAAVPNGLLIVRIFGIASPGV